MVDIIALKQRAPKIYTILTWIPSLIYGAVTKLRNLAYDVRLFHTHSFDVPVISVGNIAVGGTGKTPFVIYLCQRLQAMGESPAILARGYKSHLKSQESCAFLNQRFLMLPQSTEFKAIHADEALLQSAKLNGVPVVLGAQRWRAAERLLSETPFRPTVWVLDDGFQHRQIKRDLDIVMLGEVHRGTDFSVLPKSFFRESLSSLQRAEVCIAPPGSEASLLSELSRRFDFSALTSELSSGTITPVSTKAKLAHLLPKSQVLVWCGIANPRRFVDLVRDLGYSITKTILAPDHQKISVSDLNALASSGQPVLITEKDYFRSEALWEHAEAAVYTVPITLTLIPSDELSFDQYLRRLFRR